MLDKVFILGPTFHNDSIRYRNVATFFVAEILIFVLCCSVFYRFMNT